MSWYYCWKLEFLSMFSSKENVHIADPWTGTLCWEGISDTDMLLLFLFPPKEPISTTAARGNSDKLESRTERIFVQDSDFCITAQKLQLSIVFVSNKTARALPWTETLLSSVSFKHRFRHKNHKTLPDKTMENMLLQPVKLSIFY